MKRYTADPRWIKTRWPGICRGCGRTIRKGEDAYYYPSGKDLYCKSEACGGAAHRDFRAAASDEAAYLGHGDPY